MRSDDERLHPLFLSATASTTSRTDFDCVFATLCNATQNSSSRFMLVLYPAIEMLRFNEYQPQ